MTVSVSALRHGYGDRSDIGTAAEQEVLRRDESRHSFVDRNIPPGYPPAYPNSFWQSEEMMAFSPQKTMVSTCFDCDQERTTPLEGAVVGVAANPTWKWKKHEQSLTGRWFTQQTYLELVIFQ